MRHIWSILLFFVILIILRTIHKQMSGFRGEAVGGGGSGAAYQEVGFQDLNEAELIYEKKKEPFRGGGGEAIGGKGSGSAYQPTLGFVDMQTKKKEGFRGGEAVGGHTAGESNLGDLGSSAEFFSEQDMKRKEQIKEAFEGIGPATSAGVSGKPETSDVSGPADATLNEPRKPYNLLQQLPAAPRGSISCLNAACCAETDFEWRTNQTGNYLQRTNNYKREFPDSCSAPLTELNLAFYKNDVLRKV